MEIPPQKKKKTKKRKTPDSRQINILKNRHIPDSSHIKGETVHGTKRPRDGHHIINYIIIRLRLGKRDRSWVNQTGPVVGSPVGVPIRQAGAVPRLREAVEDPLAVVQTHVGEVPVFVFTDATENRA